MKFAASFGCANVRGWKVASGEAGDGFGVSGQACGWRLVLLRRHGVMAGAGDGIGQEDNHGGDAKAQATEASGRRRPAVAREGAIDVGESDRASSEAIGRPEVAGRRRSAGLQARAATGGRWVGVGGGDGQRTGLMTAAAVVAGGCVRAFELVAADPETAGWRWAAGADDMRGEVSRVKSWALTRCVVLSCVSMTGRMRPKSVQTTRGGDA